MVSKVFFLKTKTFKLLALGALIGAFGLFVFGQVIVFTSTTEFCTSCHEMQLVAQQGWMKSPHYQNEHGVVAKCSDCHIEPDILPMIHTKTRDGITDIWVHLFGEADPYRMDWKALKESARKHSDDSACRSCHDNLTPGGGSIKMIIAHRAYQRMDGKRKCVDCHKDEFHGEFHRYLFDERGTAASREMKDEK